MTLAEAAFALEILKPMDCGGGGPATHLGVNGTDGIVNLADRGRHFSPAWLEGGQHNRRTKVSPTRAAAPPTRRAYHDGLS
jgi:hypothetical protein